MKPYFLTFVPEQGFIPVSLTFRFLPTLHMKHKLKKKDGGVQLIKKSNDLIEARYKFDVWETRVFLFMLSHIRREDGEFHPYRLWYKDMKKVFQVGTNNRSYEYFRNGVKNLMKRQFHLAVEENGFIRETAYQILTKANYLQAGQDRPGSESQEYIDVSIHPEMKPMLLELQKNFTAYDLRNVARLGANSVRLYELLKRFEKVGKRKLEIDNLKRMLELENEYPNFGQFNQSFIKPAVKEINEFTDLNVYRVDQIKEGRKVVALYFYFRLKSDEEIKKIRDSVEVVRQMPLFPELEPEVEYQEAEIIEEMTPAIAKHFEWLNDWWGVERHEFVKRLVGKDEKDIEAAMAFTKARIKIGKAENPAGVFLDALSKGHKTIEQQKAEKQAKKAEEAREKQARLQPLIAEYETITDLQAKAINDAIRQITEEKPTVTEVVIERIKAMYQNFGDKTMQTKGIEEFRKNPMLRGMVKAEIMKEDPGRFTAINDQFGGQISAVKARILAIDPTVVFAG